MQGYFPYSYILGIYSNIKQNIVKHAYFGEWDVCETEKPLQPQECVVEISELYY